MKPLRLTTRALANARSAAVPIDKLPARCSHLRSVRSESELLARTADLGRQGNGTPTRNRSATEHR